MRSLQRAWRQRLVVKVEAQDLREEVIGKQGDEQVSSTGPPDPIIV